MKKLEKMISIHSDIVVMGITDDSRNVKEGYIFVATKGFYVDHYDYIADAIDKGCCFVVADREIQYSFPHIVVENINEYFLELCKKYYEISFDDFHFIGITGTDGKTTTATIVKELIGDCAYIGTNGLIICDELIPLSNTTPCVSELFECLAKIKKSKITNIVMEVSSEALLHHRIDGITFDIIAFTNITGDHLNVHKSFDNYVKNKMSLLNYIRKDSKVVVNKDDVNLQNIMCQNLFSFGKDYSNDFIISDLKFYDNKTTFSLKYQDRLFSIISPFYGEYNIYNLAEAFVISFIFGMPENILLQKIKNLPSISGRGERLNFGQDFCIVLDYAHTINGVKSILNSYRKFDDMIVVTGAAGGRDASKRPIIGKMVMDVADKAIFTMDDPRYEDVDTIIDEMVGDRNDYLRIIERKDAIWYALEHAHSNSVVLIIGKGRDDYMAIEDKKIPYSDYDVICEYFQSIE